MEQEVHNMNTEPMQEETYGSGQEIVLKQGKKRFSMIGLMFFFGTLIVYVVQFAAMFLFQLVKPEWLMTTTGSLLISMVPMYVIGLPLMMFLVSRVPAEKVRKNNRLSAGQVILAFMMCYAIMYISNVIGTILTTVIGVLKGSGVENSLAGIVLDTNPLVIFFLMVLCAPVFEELIFRKLLVDRAVKYGEGVAVMLSGLMFGLFHGNLSQFAYAFTLGIFFAFLYVKTGRIRYTIILHMIVNFMGSVLSIIVMNASGYMEFIQAALQFQIDPSHGLDVIMQLFPRILIMAAYGITVIAITITGVILLIVHRKKFRLAPGEVTIPKGKRFSTVIVNLGMILFSIFWLLMIIAQLFM